MTIQQPNMLLIGAAKSNSGKTTFATQLIERLKEKHLIIGIKITTIHEKDGKCHKGELSCGACCSFKGHFLIHEEEGDEENKDTTRLLQSGAQRVFWIRAHRAYMSEAIAALLEKLKSEAGDAMLICESNSLRNVLEPGLFLMVKRRESSEFKPSAEVVKGLADRIVNFDGERFDIDPDSIQISGNTWLLNPLK
jgi:molybdopterin-guanine dinucleotide biosynthesis protein